MTFDATERLNLTLMAGAVLASLLLATPGFAVSLGLGALLETLNFRGLRRGAQALFAGDAPVRRFGAAGFGPRFVLLAAAIGTALYFGAHPVGLLLGLSLIIPAAVVVAWRDRPAVDPAAPALDPDHEDWDRWNPWLAVERDRSDDEEDD